VTPKLLGKYTRELVYRDRPQKPAIVTTCGRKFVMLHQLPQTYVVGELLWIANRLNVHHSDPWCLELYQITVMPDPYMASRGHPNYPKTWFGGTRRVVVEI
jgi:hypothetical protein